MSKIITALPLATTPLAGGVVFAVVQGGTTKQVSVSALSGGVVSTAGLTTSNGTVSAASGRLGEYLEVRRSSASKLTLLDLTATDVVSLTLTAGDWDVQGVVTFIDSLATALIRAAIISTSSGVYISDGSESTAGPMTTAQNGQYSATVTRKRILCSIPTTIYLTAIASYSAGSIEAYGMLTARRMD